VRVRFLDDAATIVARVESSAPWLGAELEPRAGDGRDQSGIQNFVVVVKGRPPAMGINEATVAVVTDNSKYKVVEVSIQITLEGEYAITPQQIGVGVKPAGSTAVTRLEIRRRLGTGDFGVAKVTSSQPETIGAQAISDKPGATQSLDIQVTLPDRPGAFSESVSIVLSTGQVLQVPVSGYVTAPKEELAKEGVERDDTPRTGRGNWDAATLTSFTRI